MVVLPADSPLLWWDGFAVGFALTCVIELAVYVAAFAALGLLRPAGRLRRRDALGLALAVNLISHPLLWLVAHRLVGPGPLLLAELGVVVVEGMLIAIVTRRPAVSILVALVANGVSTAVGLIVMPLLIGR